MEKAVFIKPEPPTIQQADILGQLLLAHCSLEENDDIFLPEIKRLVEKGANINWHDSAGLTPLSWLIFHNHIAGVEYLLQQNVSLTVPENGIVQSFKYDARQNPDILRMLKDEQDRRQDIRHQQNREDICRKVHASTNPIARKRLHLKKYRP